uniref:Zinc finger, CCHC-type n=1 Tax=Tanacetum cinerariifolium TaxID=118510 RepID=A0A6L2KKG1_TANCI|nr:hypothetical protein [Tanacetum cinerariifolium]
MPAKLRIRAFELTSVVRPQGLSNPCLIRLRVAFYAINARHLPPALLVYTLVRPPMTTLVVNNSVLRGFFEKQKLIGPNFIDWYRQLRIVLSVKDKLNYLEHLILAAPVSAQAEYELLQTMREFYSCKQKEGQSISSYFLKMKSYIDNLEHLGHPMTTGLGVSLILISLRKEFDGFVQNYNMHSMGKTINELHAMLKLYEQTLPKNNAPALHAICVGKYLTELLKNKKLSQGASNSDVFTIELYNFPNKSWVYDTSCGTHICNTTHGLRGSRKLKPCALSLYMGNGQRAAVEAIGSYHLSLLSGLVIVLNNCHYVPSITRGIISVSYLYDDGYVNQFTDNSIQVSRNNMFYISDVPRDGIFEIDLSDSYTNDSSIYALCNKRAKSNLDSALLWRCRLGHISKKRIKKLQHDGLLNSTDIRSFEKYVPCMSGKMARKSYIHQVERAKDLLGLIHTNVCGPFKIVSRQGASCFVTFTDDFSRNEVWDLVELPPNGKTVGSKWLFKKKIDMDGAVHTYKARLVVKGYTQTSGIDYEETFSPVADIRVIRILIAIVAFYDYEIWQINVRKFIYGLGVVSTIEDPINMYCDNTGAITIANESLITKRARHFRAKVHYIREVFGYGDVKLEKVHRDDNLADPFTKALAFPKHSKHTKNIGMLPTSSLM